MSLYLSNIKKLDNVGKFQLQNSTLDISHYLSNLHVDYDGEVPTIFDIPCSSIIELRGDTITINVSRQEISLLLDRAIPDVDHNTLLYHVYQMYASNVSKSNKYSHDVLGYITFMYGKPSELKKLTDVINSVSAEYIESFRLDIEELKRLANSKDYEIE